MSAMARLDNKTNPTPGIGRAVIFRGKALAFQARRALLDVDSNGARGYAIQNALSEKRILAESRSLLWTEHEDAERILLAGKIHNLRLAIRRLNGVEVPAHAVFSFWKHIKRTSRLKGYVAGRELREGCLIPSIGGGLCQLSNALYDTALLAGFEIVERHAHTQVIPGSLAETQHDATVFWNYVDLRFKSTRAFRIEAELTVDSLVVRFRGEPLNKAMLFALPGNPRANANQIENCFSCGIDNCFRQVRIPTSRNDFGGTAYLVDEYWPEFDRYIGTIKRETDLLCIPLDGKRLRRPNYAWTTKGFGAIKQNRFFTLWRSYQSRKLASQGAVRQRALLVAHERLAHRYGSQLSYDITHLTVTSNLLPFLWLNGELGGRTFDVLMTGFPLAVIQKRLDAANLLHPESRTLSDFRADDWLANAETEALRQARKIISPHSEIAGLYPQKSLLIDWAIPGPESRSSVNSCKPRIVFPAATVARKGVYELRDALTGLDVQLAIRGPILEGDNFWDGLCFERLPAGNDWLAGAAAVVLPAFIEHRPRALLEAVARGVPVIASAGCGLENVSGVTTISAGDVTSLRAELEKVITKRSAIP
jgi:hypothetical protein